MREDGRLKNLQINTAQWLGSLSCPDISRWHHAPPQNHKRKRVQNCTGCRSGENPTLVYRFLIRKLIVYMDEKSVLKID